MKKPDKPKETTLERYTMIVREVKEHEGYIEWTRMCNDPNIVAKLGRMPTKILGKYQYMFKNIDTQNEISLVELPNYFNDGITFWEIYCTYGNLFEDVQRFDTYEKAEKAIKKYLV